ncbi:MAG: DNA polymerase IV [Candidatus Absconditabacteria bacterium]
MDYTNIKSQKVWGLVDCDSFFASCEVMRNPTLQGKPVCVGVDIVLAATYEAKKYKIKTGTPVWEAIEMVNNLVVLPPDISFYGRVSSQIMSILSEFCNNIEIFSIDEAFIDITGKNVEFNMDYNCFVLMVQSAIKKRVGIPVSIGVGTTRLISKILAPINKPYGTLVVLDGIILDNIFKLLPIRNVPFIGKKSEEKVRHLCKSIYEFKSLNYKQVRNLLQGGGLKIWFELNGVNVMSLGNSDIPKSISRTRSFNPHFTKDKNILFEHLILNFERAFEELTLGGLETKCMKIFLKDKGFKFYKSEVIFPQHTCDKNLLLKSLNIIFDELYIPQKYFRTTGVVFFDVKNNKYLQKTLVGLGKQDNKKLWQIINKINKKFGRFTVTCASNKNIFNSKKKDSFLSCI